MARTPSDSRLFRVSLPKSLIERIDEQHWIERRDAKDIVAEAIETYLDDHPVPPAPTAA